MRNCCVTTPKFSFGTRARNSGGKAPKYGETSHFANIATKTFGSRHQLRRKKCVKAECFGRYSMDEKLSLSTFTHQKYTQNVFLSIALFHLFTHSVMSVYIARQIITDYIPVRRASINRLTRYRRTNIIRQLCIFRAGRDEYHGHHD